MKDGEGEEVKWKGGGGWPVACIEFSLLHLHLHCVAWRGMAWH